MSWFGEHLTSFTEKITDFTKDMLPDSGTNSATDDQSSQSDSLSSQLLLKLCKEKDAEIELLMNEKSSLEKSIDELELQHQEAVTKLLDLKNEAVKENAALKEELVVQKDCISIQSLFQKFEHNYYPGELKKNDIQSITEDMYSKCIKNFNLINIIGVLWKNYGEGTLKNFLKWLKEQKLLLEAQVVDDDNRSNRNVIKRINNYIMFLQLMAEDPELFFPVIDEIASVIYFLLSDNGSENSKFSVPESIGIQSAGDSSSATEIERNDFSSQTIINDFKHIKDLFSINPEPYLCNDVDQSKTDSAEALASSQHVQTENENSTQNCNSVISELKEYISLLEQEKEDLVREVSQFEEHISNLQEQLQLRLPPSSSCVFIQTENIQDEIRVKMENCCTSSVCVQTDDFANDTRNMNLLEFKTYVDILEREKSDFQDKLLENEIYINMLEQEKSDFKDKILELQSRMNESTLSVQTQTDDVNTINARIFEHQTYVDLLEQEEPDFQDKLEELQSSIDKLSVLTQTDGFTCDCNVYELEASICILEQEKADLEEEISCLKSSIDKPKSSVHIQTEEDSVLSEMLQMEITTLQEMLSVKESDYSDSLQELSNELNNFKEKLKISESVILEKEDIIQCLEQNLEEYKNNINDLTVRIQKIASSTSVQTQTDESNCSCKQYELQIEELRRSMDEREKEYSEVQNQTIISVNNLKKELNSYECLIAEKDSLFCNVNSELEKYKSEISNLAEELNSLKETTLINTNEFSSTCQKYESEFKALKNCISEKEKEFFVARSDLISNVNNLRDLLQSKDLLINEKENTIQSLKVELEETKKYVSLKENEVTSSENELVSDINNLRELLHGKDQLINDKEETIQFLKSELEELKKYVTVKENEVTSSENELVSDINNLSKLLQGKDQLINDKEATIHSLKSELEKLKNYISIKENELTSSESDLVCNVNNLKELLQSKDLLISDKEETIHSLKLELEEAKISIKNYLSDLKAFKAKQDYAKDIDTMEEHDIKMIMQNCNRCQNIINGESTDNDLKNEVRVLQDKLKALDMDKNQLLCVLNEKTQECSSLKAEVHKLTNIVASEKQALYKLQQDNCLLRESRENADPELTKEAIQNLSRIIRDKDLEIESLTQKNVTLTALIQDATLFPDHMQSLMEEKENLAKQINVFKADRDKIMVRYNTIDKDCRQYAAEVKKLRSALSEQKEKFDVLEQKHFSVAQQYEEKQKSLINTQNEMIALKQRVSDLEQQQVDIKEKYSELLNKFNSDTTVQLTKDELEEKNSQIQQLTTANSEKDHLIQEKDCLIHDLSQQIKTLKLEHEQQQLNLTSLQSKVEELTAKIKELETVVDKYQTEKEALELRFDDKSSELGLLKDMNERLNMSLKEKEFTIQSMTEKISSLSHYISSDHTTSDTVDINQILADSESLFSKAQTLYKERDETLLALNQSKQENQSLRNEIQRMKSNEIHLKKELERLRMHLLEIEENYTTEALKAEEREKELRDELVEVKRRAEISNTAIVDTNQRASIQIASLQEQLSMIANQRDQALAQVSILEDKVQQHSASVSKLQLVLEQMQRGNERKVKETEKKFLAQLEKQQQLYLELERKLQAKEVQLEESTQALEAASRLSEQLDAKEEIIANLKSELSKTESKIKSTAQEIDTIKSNTEGKVDRVVMKSLVLGYFSTPPGQKSEVIRLLARVLDFNQEEMEKAGIVVGRSVQRNEQKGLLSSIFGRLPSLSSEKNPSTPEKSFTTLFVQFLENESQPIVPMPFPAEKMAHDLSFKQHTNKRSPTAERKSISRSNPLLLDIDSAFPTFSPVPAVEYSQAPAPSILREVLE